MDLTITQLPPETMQALNALAAEKGKSPEEYVRDVIEREISKSKSFREILAPIQKGFQESGMTEEELIAMFEEAREDVYQESLKQPR